MQKSNLTLKVKSIETFVLRLKEGFYRFVAPFQSMGAIFRTLGAPFQPMGTIFRWLGAPFQSTGVIFYGFNLHFQDYFVSNYSVTFNISSSTSPAATLLTDFVFSEK